MPRPRVGFLGVGWIGRSRMEAMLATGLIEAAALCEPAAEMRQAALAMAPDAVVAADLDALLAQDLDGIVVATPSALHADQSIRCLEAGTAVFCQKPLGLDAASVCAVVEAARRADRLLGVDLSYRHTTGMARIADLVARGELGRVFAIDLTFHNAYGPDKPWFYDKALSGGGCVMDLGVHLVDLALWLTGFPALEGPVHATLRAGGAPLGPDTVEDYAEASFALADGPSVRLACSWRLNAGRDAIIAVRVYGTAASASFANVGGSFYDFTAELHHGTATTALETPPDDWGGRAAAAWARALAGGAGFDPASRHLVDVSAVLDRIYAASRAVS